MSCFLHGLFYAMNLLSAVSLFSLILGSVALPPPRPQASQTSFGLVGYAKAGPGGFGETTGGQGGKIFDVTNDKELQRAIKDKSSEKKIIYIHGTVALSKRFNIPSDTSVIGTGSGGILTSHGINVKNVTNVIIQNLKISRILDNDGITIQNATRVWIDHNEFESDCCTGGPDVYDGQIDVVRATDFVTISWNYFHDHWKSSLVGNKDSLRQVDDGHLRVTYHHNYWKNEATRGPAGRFGHQHIFNNLYEDFLYQAIHSRSDNQVLVEANVFRGKCTEALSTYGLVIPMDSPNTSPEGDEEIDGFANLGAENDFGSCKVNITKEGHFTSVPYQYSLTPLSEVEQAVRQGAGIGKLEI
ncbi:Deoxyribonuclease [Venturia inaequalis]|nr:Deoxyribonuclease [Venturia inaequalis]